MGIVYTEEEEGAEVESSFITGGFAGRAGESSTAGRAKSFPREAPLILHDLRDGKSPRERE